MNFKYLLLAATAAAFVALNFTSCKEKDEDDFDSTFENCVESIGSMSGIINDGDFFLTEWVNILKFEPTIKDIKGLWCYSTRLFL